MDKQTYVGVEIREYYRHQKWWGRLQHGGRPTVAEICDERGKYASVTGVPYALVIHNMTGYEVMSKRDAISLLRLYWPPVQYHQGLDVIGSVDPVYVGGNGMHLYFTRDIVWALRQIPRPVCPQCGLRWWDMEQGTPSTCCDRVLLRQQERRLAIEHELRIAEQERINQLQQEERQCLEDTRTLLRECRKLATDPQYLSAKRSQSVGSTTPPTSGM